MHKRFMFWMFLLFIPILSMVVYFTIGHFNQSSELTLATKIQEEQYLPALSRQIIELARIHGEISVKEIQDSIGANRNTIKAHLKKLTELHYLKRLGKGRGVRYVIM